MLRHASELARCVYDFCSERPISPVARSRCLLRVVSAAHTLMTVDSSLIGGLSRLPCRLLIRRLQCGPNPAQTVFDCKLREIITSNIHLSVEYVESVMELLRSETWGSSGCELRVSYCEFLSSQTEMSQVIAVVYLRSCASRLDAVSSQAVQSFLQGTASNYPDLEPQLTTEAAGNPAVVPMNEDANDAGASHLRVTLQSVVSTLIVPDQLRWKGFEREDATTCIQRILDAIKSRWAR